MCFPSLDRHVHKSGDPYYEFSSQASPRVSSEVRLCVINRWCPGIMEAGNRGSSF